MHSNQQELVGTQDMDSTIEAINGSVSALSPEKQKEAKQTYAALQQLHTHFCQAEAANLQDSSDRHSPDYKLYKASHSLFLTEEIILQLHRCLLHDIHHGAGSYRQSPVATLVPGLVASSMQSIIDQHNSLLHNMPDNAGVADYVNLAAWLFLRFVSLHLFVDGNGRIGRLLASFTLMQVCPYPVSMLPLTDSQSPRDFYLDAIIRARAEGCRLLQPADLSTLLIENMWRGWCMVADTFARQVTHP